MLNLDTHVLLHALAGELTAREHALLGRATWSISAIVLWEIAKLVELGRVAVDLDGPDLTRAGEIGTVEVDGDAAQLDELCDLPEHDRRNAPRRATEQRVLAGRQLTGEGV